jgi:hypothetical protein
MKSNNRLIEQIPVGFVYFDGVKSYVLSAEEAKNCEQFVPPNAKHTATVALDIVLERILNKEDGVKQQLKEMVTL